MLRRQRPDSLLSVCAFTGVTAATWLAEEDKTPPTGGVGGNRKVGVPLFADGKGKSQVSLPGVTGKRRGLGPQTHACAQELKVLTQLEEPLGKGELALNP